MKNKSDKTIRTKTTLVPACLLHTWRLQQPVVPADVFWQEVKEGVVKGQELLRHMFEKFRVTERDIGCAENRDDDVYIGI